MPELPQIAVIACGVVLKTKRVMSDTNCPYCDAEIEINHDDGYGYTEDLHQQNCHSCGKTFTFTTAVLYVYETFKAKCLNGGKHKFEPN